MTSGNEHTQWYFTSTKNGEFRLNSKAERLATALNVQKIDIGTIRALSMNGNPDEPNGLRALIWKLLLEYLPEDTSEWESVLASHRQNYEILKEEVMIVPSVEDVDHPLSNSQSSRWKTYFEDQEVWEIIDKDIRRTRHDMFFFLKPADPSLSFEDVANGNIPRRKYARPFLTEFVDVVADQESNPYLHALLNNENIEKHADVTARILFIYAKLNKNVKYVQGMNEILAPIYYLFCMDRHPLFDGHAEADSFFCFTSVMSSLRDSFVKTFDLSESGLKGHLKKINKLIKFHDREIYEKLKELKVSTYYYAVKWVLLLFGQELPLPELFRLWDYLFADPDRFSYLHYFCTAVVLRAKTAVMGGDLAEALTALQHPCLDDIQEIIAHAQQLAACAHD